MAIDIQDATPFDAGAILELLAQANLPQDGLTDHLETALVAKRDGRVVGAAALEVYADGGLLRSVAVDPRLRGVGLGIRLTEAAIRRARKQALPALYLLTTTAEDFFPRFGFTRISREDVPASVRESVEFKGACPDTAVVMRKLLGENAK